MYQKKFEELELRDDFIFGKVMRNKAICKQTLEILLGIQIENIEYPETQKAINITYQGKSVRLDVYVEDDKRSIYNAEMQQKGDEENICQLPKRSRYYQGMIDLNLIEKGLPYTALNTSYVIFICTFDPFGKGNLQDAPVELRKFLQYIETNQPESTFTKQLDHEVKRAKQNEKWRREYMKELLHDFDMKEEGRREGREEGKQKLNRLIQLLAKQNRTEDIIRSAQDAEYQKKLFEEFQI